jgi:ABC-type multidrug transport system permease subunit
MCNRCERHSDRNLHVPLLPCRHELTAGAYGLTPFLVSKLAIGLPLEAALVAAAGSLLYALLGLQPHADNFGSFLLLSVLCALCASNCGNLLGLALPDLTAALPAMCIGVTLLLAFAGFIGEQGRQQHMCTVCWGCQIRCGDF